MRKLLFLLLLLTVVCSGCGWRNIFNDDDEYIFQKKMECANLKEQIEEDLKKEEEKYKTMKMMDGFSNSLDEIFFSPKLNTCMYTFSNYFHTNFANESFSELNIRDALTGEMVYKFTEVSYWENDNKDRSKAIDRMTNEFNIQVIELK